jgi:Spy/CpxP family protein refolding chaperone
MKEEAVRTHIIILAAAALVYASSASPALGQSAPPSPTAELGVEPANWGLTPFAAVSALALRPEDRSAIRALEDRHIAERRAFEDKYENELRQLIRKQADEREALRARLAGK